MVSGSWSAPDPTDDADEPWSVSEAVRRISALGIVVTNSPRRSTHGYDSDWSSEETQDGEQNSPRPRLLIVGSLLPRSRLSDRTPQTEPLSRGRHGRGRRC